MKVSKYFFTEFIFVLIASLFLFPTEAKAERFSVTGYYSPLPKQEFYLTGNYESELRLNGQGIAGADGTGVHYGMIAAPANYKFGTSICLEKLGCGVVHDRGGAIVNKGERRKATHDRIDFWMGYGMDGLRRSLLWGRQDVKGRIVGQNVDRSKSGRSIKISSTILEIIRQKIPENIFNENLYPGTNKSSVKKLKDSLAFLSLFKEDINTKYDENLKKAVIKFQQKYKIINNDSDYGAGNFGPQTRKKIYEIIRLKINKKLHSQWSSKVFEENLGYTDHGINVYRLQQLLYDNKFLEVSPTGFFGNKTKKAVIKFQMKYNLVDTVSSIGAGNIGPKTRKKLTEMWLKKRDSLFVLPKQEIINVP
jgi:3D (Asp-Asp-Asp) domain-containing protein